MKKFSEKYRPRDRSMLIGTSQLEAYDGLIKKEPQTCTLIGNSGVGKTTIGKMYAAHLLGRSIDDLNKESSGFQHVNSRIVGIDYFRKELVEHLHSFPLFSDKKVYLIDEIHSLKSDAEQRVLLTVLENLPDFTYLIFCTDRPKTLDSAFRSRLEPIIHLSVPTMPERKAHMIKILAMEGIQLEGQSVEGATRTISKDDATAIYQDSSGNLRSMIDKIESWIAGYFTPTITDEAEKDDFVKEMFNVMSLSEAFTLAKTIDNYNSTLHGLCGYAIAILSRDSNSKKAGIASKILSVFGQGLSPSVSEKVAFHYLLNEYFNN